MNNSGQMQVLEVIVVAGMLLLALYFVKSMDVSQFTTMEKQNRLEVIGNSILKNLEDQPDPTGENDTLLISYIKDSKNDGYRLENYVLTALPEGAIFRVSLINYTKLVQNAADIGECTEILINPDFQIGDITTVSKIVVIDGVVYEIILDIWYTAGG